MRTGGQAKDMVLRGQCESEAADIMAERFFLNKLEANLLGRVQSDGFARLKRVYTN
jgi:hypothetical protein